MSIIPLSPDPKPRLSRGSIDLFRGDVIDAYRTWPAPVVIVSDGAYGVAGFDGDPERPEDLPAWYRGHVGAWSAAATPETTLWFWAIEIGWANIHALLASHGWQFRACHTWNRGYDRVREGRAALGPHFPLVTEIAVQYVRGADAKWRPLDGLTNVWDEPSNIGPERLRDATGELVHPNQKPLRLMERIISATSDEGDVVWEPFAGLATASIAAARLGRLAYAAERRPDYAELAAKRISADLSMQG
jgi:hypothetical protein